MLDQNKSYQPLLKQSRYKDNFRKGYKNSGIQNL